MKTAAYFFFYLYVASLVVFGAVCVFTARFDQHFLFSLDTGGLGAATAASLLSQYRFSRAVECGFGVFALMFRPAIFEQRPYNRLFLGTMLGGVAARLVSLALDGRPFPVFYGFLIIELVGGVVIFLYTRTTLQKP